MRYFKYHYNEKSGKIWSLFNQIAETQQSQTEFGLSCDYAHTLEIVHAAMSGSISLDEDSVNSFNLRAYEYACSENDKIGRIKRAEKELFIVDSFSDEGETKKVGFGDIPSNSVRLSTQDKRLDEIVNDDAFNKSLEELLGIRTKVFVEYGLDIVQALREALVGTKDAVDNIKLISDKNEQVKNVIVALCTAESGRLLNSLSCCG